MKFSAFPVAALILLAAGPAAAADGLGIRKDGTIIGRLEDDGTIRRGRLIWGSVDEGCPDHAARRKTAAVLVFFDAGYF
jgi:hypothetical protein